MKYRISRRADRDVEAIWKHIAKESKETADRVEAELHAAMKLLAGMPGMGHTREDVAKSTYRFWSVYSYLIAYRVERKRIVVVRVVHGSRDLRKLFKRE